jgi:hypothetical protein
MTRPAIVRDVRVDDERITFILSDGREIAAPTRWSPRLAAASPVQRAAFEIESDGLIVAWPDIDEHIGVWTLLGVSEEEAFLAAGLEVVHPARR